MCREALHWSYGLEHGLLENVVLREELENVLLHAILMAFPNNDGGVGLAKILEK